MYPGEESVCIVTYLDRINNAWLCLSEKGCTFKVPCDEVEEGLSEGMLVRVRYIEPDRSGQSIEFFMGELSENQDNLPLSIKKSQCLYNLMQGMGEISGFGADRNSKVVEVEEVMSHDELMELIYMFQRCAYSEKEYIKAFNYLGLASLLSKLAEAPDLIKEISTHMELLQLLQDFGRNHTVDPVMLSSCENKVKNTPMLERLHTRLKIVADLDLNGLLIMHCHSFYFNILFHKSTNTGMATLYGLQFLSRIGALPTAMQNYLKSFKLRHCRLRIFAKDIYFLYICTLFISSWRRP